MEFNEHSNLKGKHAFLSASKYHWLNYDISKMLRVYESSMAVERGNRLHALACELISMHVKLPRSSETLNAYVNDAISFGMKPEQVLYYSNNCFGTADSILFNERKKILRIHDLKTGETPAHMEQLEIYDALFCLEYNVNPFDISHALRIYQSNKVLEHSPDPDAIRSIMEIIVNFDKAIEEYKAKGEFL